MLQIGSFSRQVSPRIRSRGAAYFGRRAARLLRSDEHSAAFEVRGTRPYRVTLTCDRGVLRAACDCPYVASEGRACKHVWAALLEAQLRQALPEARALRRLAVESSQDDPDAGSEIAPAHGADWRHALDLLGPAPLEDVGRGLPAVLAAGELVYVLEGPREGEGRPDGLVVRLLGRSRRADGAWSKLKPVTLTTGHAPALREEADRRILALLSGARDGTWAYDLAWVAHASIPNPARIPPEAADALLPLLCATGRLFGREPGDGDAPLQWEGGEAWRFGVEVRASPEGERWVARGTLARGDVRLDAGAAERVLGPGLLQREGRIARFTPADGFRLLAHLLRRGKMELPTDDGARFVAALLARRPRPELDVPDELLWEEVDLSPIPEVRILPSRRSWGAPRLRVEVSFDYDGHRVSRTQASVDVVDADRRRLLRRDVEAEARAAERLRALGCRPPPRTPWADTEPGDVELSDRHLPRLVRALLAEGWRVEAEHVRYRAPGTSRVQVASGVDWFELQGGVEYEGTWMPLPKLLAALAKGQGFVALGDGSVGLLPEEWLQRQARLASLGRVQGDAVRFAPAQVALLDALLSEMPEASCDAGFARARARLQRFSGIGPVDPPRAFRGTLRPYQRDGLGWLQFLREFGFGGCLADDMGLGKTVQVLALLAGRRAAGSRKGGAERRPSLVVVPRSLVFNWKEEAARFAPRLRVLDHTGPDRPKDASALREADLVLTTYGTLRRDAAFLKDLELDYAVLDEAQAIKNARSQSSKAARLLRARHRLVLSGTPIENHLGELWSLFEFLNPGMLGGSPAFQLGADALRNPEGEARTLLARALRPFLLRRTKAQVAPELPARTEQTLWCELEREQRTLYDQLKQHYRALLLPRIDRVGMGKAAVHVLEALLRLRQTACHAALLDPRREDVPSAKLEALFPHLSAVVEEGHKALVFSQFTSFLGLLRPRLQAAGIPFAYLDGKTAPRARRAEVARFQEDPGCPVFLISLKAGGLGLNLTAAEYVYLLDPWWNPAVEAQAVDRAHRIGQGRAVFAYRLVARDTVEEKILDLQAEKRALAEAILTADASLFRTLTREDVAHLLG